MIKVNIKYEKDEIKQIIVSGHANYDEFGKDIVCSSASSILITTVNGISRIDDEYIDVIENNDEVILNINKDNYICNELILNMIDMYKELEEQYPKNLKIK